jgi:hypothetical protein
VDDLKVERMKMKDQGLSDFPLGGIGVIYKRISGRQNDMQLIP